VLTAQEVTDSTTEIRGTSGDDGLFGSRIIDSLYGYEGNDWLFGNGGDDLIDGGEGVDYLYGQEGNDVLYGQAGTDYLYSGYGDDVLDGGEGDDFLSGEYGNDVLDGGLGNDSLSGDLGNDLYLFGRGLGQDTIYNYDWIPEDIDTLRFAQDVARSDVEIVRSGDDMVFRIKGTSDQVTVQQWMADPSYQLEKVEFGDGTVLTAQEVTDSTTEIRGTSGDDGLFGSRIIDSLYGYEGNDWLFGNGGDDLIDGGEGNDYLIDGEGNNILYGGLGSDVLYGGAGADTLDGGLDNDYLSGGYGDDLYLFGRGSGQDVISEYDPTPENNDRVKFGSGVNPIDLIFVEDGNDLKAQIYNSSDLLTVQNQNLSSAYQVEAFETDGMRLISSYVGQLIQAMAEFSAQNSGMSWTQLIENRPQDVQMILAQYWQPPQ
jgi:Ca2+-binding RTX toxin-like protein